LPRRGRRDSLHQRSLGGLPTRQAATHFPENWNPQSDPYGRFEKIRPYGPPGATGLLGRERILDVAYNALIRSEREKLKLPGIARAGEFPFVLLCIAGDQYMVSMKDGRLLDPILFNECIGDLLFVEKEMRLCSGEYLSGKPVNLLSGLPRISSKSRIIGKSM